VATVINNVRAAVGSSNVLLLDAGDEMQGSLLSNLQKGAPTIDVFNNMGYQVATLGNHEFDWGQTVLISAPTRQPIRLLLPISWLVILAVALLPDGLSHLLFQRLILPKQWVLQTQLRGDYRRLYN
jgi:hypothetical protein